MAGVGGVPGVNYEPVTSTEPIDLNGTDIRVVMGAGHTCTPVELEDGQVYTLFSTTGGLSGELDKGTGINGYEPYESVPQGGTIPVYQGLGLHECGGAWESYEPALRIEYNETGEPQTVTGTVVKGSTERVSAVRVSSSSERPVTNQPVTLTATVEASTGVPSGTLAFGTWLGGTPTSGCGLQPVTEIEGGYGAVCDTVFAADEDPCFEVPDPGCYDGPEQFDDVEFQPAPGVRLEGSSGNIRFDAKPVPTATSVSVSTQTPLFGEPVSYTATVTPEYLGAVLPTGTVEFRDGTHAIEGCSAQPLIAATELGASSATCSVTYGIAGEHAISATYTYLAESTPPYRDGAVQPNFLGSTSTTQAVTVQPAPTGSSVHSALVEAGVLGSVVGLTPVSGSTDRPDSALTGPLTPGDVSLATRRIAVRGGKTAIAVLRCSGSLACSGTLALSGRKRHASRPFGAAAFLIAADSTERVPIELTAAGRAALDGPGTPRSRWTLALRSDTAGAPVAQTDRVDVLRR